MSISLVLPRTGDEQWALPRRIGVSNAGIHTLEISDGIRAYEYEELARISDERSDASTMTGQSFAPGSMRGPCDGVAAEST